MRGWLSLVCALMLAVMLWTGSVAHAAGAIGCVEVSADSVGHFEGDSDQVPADSGKGVPHHHGGCSGHCIGVPANAGTVEPAKAGADAPSLCTNFGLPTREPDRTLRPPIA